jgi:hypothetical protein
MTKRSKDWGWLVASVLMILLGIKALTKGHVQHFLMPAFEASGLAATFLGIFCLTLGAISLICWLKKKAGSRE